MQEDKAIWLQRFQDLYGHQHKGDKMPLQLETWALRHFNLMWDTWGTWSRSTQVATMLYMMYMELKDVWDELEADDIYEE